MRDVLSTVRFSVVPWHCPLEYFFNLGRTQPRPFEKLCRYRLDGPPILSAQGSGLLFQPLNTLIIVRKSMLNEKVGGIAKCPTPTSGCGASS